MYKMHTHTQTFSHSRTHLIWITCHTLCLLFHCVSAFILLLLIFLIWTKVVQEQDVWEICSKSTGLRRTKKCCGLSPIVSKSISSIPQATKQHNSSNHNSQREDWSTHVRFVRESCHSIENFSHFPLAWKPQISSPSLPSVPCPSLLAMYECMSVASFRQIYSTQ